MDSEGHVRRTRSSAIWIGLIAAAVVLIALLIFVGQNSKSVSVHYLGANGRVPLAVALLLSAVAGLLIAAIPGTVRILQLRRAVKKNAQA
jgi:putative membrane protein